MKYFYAALGFSSLLALAGIFLSLDAYYEKISVLAAVNQIEYIRNMPNLADGKGQKKMPLYMPSGLFEKNKKISGTFTTAIDPLYNSLRSIDAKVSRAPFGSVELYSVIDVRMRK